MSDESRADQTLVVVGGKRRGRPRIETPRTSMSTWVPATEYDAIIRMAMQQGVTVSRCLRTIVRAQLGSSTSE